MFADSPHRHDAPPGPSQLWGSSRAARANGGYGGSSLYDPIWDGWLLGSLIVAVVAVVLILVTGHLSALVFDGGWPRYRAGDIPRVLWGVVDRPGDPGRAWDPFNRGADPPGPVAWWATLAAIVGAGGTPVMWAHRARQRGRRYQTSHWAERHELSQLRVRSRCEGRLVVGTADRRPIAVEARHSLLVFGPSHSGKTTTTAIPAILGWPGPVVATTVKDDLITDTRGWRAGLGDVMVYDPADISAYAGSGWSPLAGVVDGASASKAAWEMSMATKSAIGSGVNLAKLWFTSAAKCFAPYLLAAAVSGRGMDDVARWVDAEERHEVLALLGATHRDAGLAHEATFRRDDKARSSLFQCMQLMTTAYLDPAVATSAATSDIVAARLLDGGSHTLYVSSPPKDQDRLRPLFATLVGQVIGAVYEHAAATRAPLVAPLLLVLDEAANIAPVDDLATIASTAASMGLQMVTVFQDLAQIRLRYEGAADTIVNNHRAKLLLPGASDLGTLELFSRLAGEEEVDRASVTTDGSGRRSATTAGQFRRLLPVEAARELESGHGVMIYGSLPAIRLRLRPWYKDRRLRTRARRTTAAHLAPSPAPSSPSAPGAPAPSPSPATTTARTAPRSAPASDGWAMNPRRPRPAARDAATTVVSVLDSARSRRDVRRRSTREPR